MRDRSTGWPAADLTRQQGEKRRDASELSVYPNLFERQHFLMDDWARYLAQGSGEGR